VAQIRKLSETTSDDYARLGMKSGLEIHQQLATRKKLFCRCPVVRPYVEEYDAEILRHMRPTLSELGEYDGTALMEFKTKKEIIYQIRNETVCTYEMDDTPPFELNQEALDIALEVTMLLGCNLVSEVHIARKQYLDGSIPTGFQRTTILGVDGSIPYKGRRIGIRQLGLEEDACREVSDVGHLRTYRTDRLGFALIESVTYPDMRTPREVAEVAQVLRWLARSTGKMHTGIGAGRQDVNVSIEGGRRVEIKGVSRIRAIPLLVHNEAFRQAALLEIKADLARRGITTASFRADVSNVTELVAGTQYYPLAKALRGGLEARAVVLRGFRGILSWRTQPETTFAKEISDRVRVIACLTRLPNIAHSDQEGETLSSTEWTRLKKASRAADTDTIVLVWGDRRDVETGAGEIALRAREALDGVPNETRQALPDGTNGFERILPGPDRMYPDTDLPPLAITEERIERIRAIMAERPWERATRYEGLGLSRETADLMSRAPERFLFDRLVAGGAAYPPRAVAGLLLGRVRHLRRRGALPRFDDERFAAAVAAASAAKAPVELLLPLVEKMCGAEGLETAAAIATLGIRTPAAAKKDIAAFLRGLERPAIERAKLERYLMGLVMEKFRGAIPGKLIAEMVSASAG
jgi:glutamyl-tRNA(Gln) amidotransferase subunit E